MAAPITHIVLAKELLETHKNTFSKRDFLIGTVFPDIRYLRVIKREETHKLEITLQEVLSGKNSFHSGLLFHSLVDRVRENFIIKQDIYSINPNLKYIAEALKFIEDEFLFERVRNWHEVASCMDNILKEEMEFSIKREQLEKWHNLLKEYFSHKPDKHTRKKFFVELDVKPETIKEIEKTISILKKNRKVMKILKSLYKDFNELLDF